LIVAKKMNRAVQSQWQVKPLNQINVWPARWSRSGAHAQTATRYSVSSFGIECIERGEDFPEPEIRNDDKFIPRNIDIDILRLCWRAPRMRIKSTHELNKLDAEATSPLPLPPPQHTSSRAGLI
jgi:hypothetical protein